MREGEERVGRRSVGDGGDLLGVAFGLLVRRDERCFDCEGVGGAIVNVDIEWTWRAKCGGVLRWGNTQQLEPLAMKSCVH